LNLVDYHINRACFYKTEGHPKITGHSYEKTIYNFTSMTSVYNQ